MSNSIERISKCTFMNQLFNVQYIFDFFFKFGLFSPPKLVEKVERKCMKKTTHPSA